MKARYVIGKKLLGTVPFMKAGSAAICLVATTMEAYVAYIKLQKAREDLDSDKTKGNNALLYKEAIKAMREYGGVEDNDESENIY